MRRIGYCLVLLSLTACKALDPAEPIPSYLQIRNPRVVKDLTDTEYSTLGIKDVWVYQNRALIGTFPIPCTIPFLNQEQSGFTLQGGIYETGQASSRLFYPFWKDVNLTVSLTGNDTFVVEPVFELKESPDITIQFEEEFDNDIDLEPFVIFNDTASLIFSQSEVFQGPLSGKVNFSNGHRFFQVRTFNTLIFDAQSDAYAEITYKSDVELTIGLAYSNSTGTHQSPILTVLPSADWNTVYVHLINDIRVIESQDENSYYWLYLSADGNNENHTLYLDNLRVINN